VGQQSGAEREVQISVCIVCRNEADKLADCLASVAWADEVLVMDLESTDGSDGLARRAGAVVVRRAPHPVVEPLRDEIAEHARGTWVLAMDPDERVRPGLAQALRAAAQRTDVDAVVLPRMNVDFGWAPESPAQRFEPQLRMYRRSAVSWPHFPNRLPSVPAERTLRLEARDDLVLEHHRNRSVAETAERLVRYPTAQAQAMLDAGQVFSAADMLHLLGRKARRYYVEERAWEEGVPGLVRATVRLNHHVHVWMAFWQLSGAPRTPEDDAAVRRAALLLRGFHHVTAVGRTPRRAARRIRSVVRRPR
jgi:glycosyltransferase involved in cell wall biosynthesis